MIREDTETPRLRPLDLSNLLKHAWRAGADGDEWPDYDPTQCVAYERVTAALARAAGIKTETE